MASFIQATRWAIYGTALMAGLCFLTPRTALAQGDVLVTSAQLAELQESNRLSNEVLQLYQQGKFRDAIPLALRALEIRQRITGENQAATATTLNNLGALYEALGDFRSARQYHERALAIRLKVVGVENSDTAMSYNNLGLLVQALGDYAAARRYFEQALGIFQRTLGERHNHTATCLYNLGNLAQVSGDFALARRYQEQALALNRRLVGDDHPDTARVLNNLGMLAVATGDHAAAKQYHEQALAIRRKHFGEANIDTARSLNNLGAVYESRGEFAAAQPYWEQALAAFRAAVGDEHFDTALCRSNLGCLTHSLGNAEAARDHLEQALQTQRKIFGAKNSNIALTLHNLGVVFDSLNDVPQMRSQTAAALEISRELLGDHHPQTVRAQYLLTTALSRAGELALAAQHLHEARQGVRQHVRRILPSLSESEQATFLKLRYLRELHAALSFGYLQSADVALQNLAAEWLMNGKAVAEESLAQRNLLARDTRDPNLAPALQELMHARRMLATLAMSATHPNQAAARQQLLEQLTKREQQLSSQLGAVDIGATAANERWIDINQLRRVMSKDSVFVDIARFEIIDLRLPQRQQTWAPARYVAWIVTPNVNENVALVDLGPAAEIEPLVARIRSRIQADAQEGGSLTKDGEAKASADLAAEMQKLAERIWRPLAPHVAHAQEIVLSPDGTLWLVPWNALPLDNGNNATCLLEKHRLRLVISGRDLVLKSAAGKPSVPAILANPQFDQGLAEKQSSIQAIFQQLPVPNATLTDALATKSLLPKVSSLPGTAVEAAAIKPNVDRFAGREATLYSERYALESVAKELRGPQVAVFATHGFFLPEQQTKTSSADLATMVSGDTRSAALDLAGKPVENPLLRCGLLLAGCNNREAMVGDDDGILTGLEIVGTDFRGTELVVLSACETGLGDVRNGEGVAGLRQAFQLAGAKSVVASLWQVPDRDSALIMADFFTNLADGQSKAEALRQAQLKRIQQRRERNGEAHPFFWAAWTVTGN